MKDCGIAFPLDLIFILLVASASDESFCSKGWLGPILIQSFFDKKCNHSKEMPLYAYRPLCSFLRVFPSFLMQVHFLSYARD